MMCDKLSYDKKRKKGFILKKLILKLKRKKRDVMGQSPRHDLSYLILGQSP